MEDSRFELRIKNNTIHDLNDLRDKFNLESVLEYYISGELTEWLTDAGEKELADKVEELEPMEKDFFEKLCSLLGAENVSEQIDAVKVSTELLKELADNCIDEEDNNVNSRHRIAAFYSKAAESEDAEALCDLGLCYYNGYGLEQDREKAAKLFTISADKGNADGQMFLGVCYFNGFGLEKDMEKAVELARAAAQSGDVVL